MQTCVNTSRRSNGRKFWRRPQLLLQVTVLNITYTMSVATSSSRSGKMTISDPQKQGEGMSQFISYKVIMEVRCAVVLSFRSGIEVPCLQHIALLALV